VARLTDSAAAPAETNGVLLLWMRSYW